MNQDFTEYANPFMSSEENPNYDKLNINMPINENYYSFSDSIKRFFSGYFNFEGRSPLSEFWYSTLFVGIVNTITSLITMFVNKEFATIQTIISLILLIPTLAVTVRRYHDTGHSGFNIIIPIYNFYLLFKKSQGNNKYGPGPKSMQGVLPPGKHKRRLMSPKNKLLIQKTLVIFCNVLRLVVIVACGYGVLSSIVNVLAGDKFPPLFFLYLIIAGLAFISKDVLKWWEKKVNFLIDNFEDTAKHSRQKGKYGQINEYGYLNVGLMLKRGSIDALGDLNKMIGLQSVKDEVLRMKSLYEYEKAHPDQKRKDNVARHLLFLGNPGSGKTVVASIFSGLLYEYGRIKKNMYLPITASDLAGDMYGQTSLRIESVFKKCKGGVIFIDEAYSLCLADSVTSNEIIAQLLVQMEANPDTVLIFAGYTEEMKQFINMNPGIASRIATTIEFPDYNASELVQITKLFFKERNLQLSPEAENALYHIYQQKINITDRNFSNGRYARNCFDKIYQQHAISYQLNNSQEKDNIIVASDITSIGDILLSQS